MDELAILAAASRFHRDGVGAVLAVVVRTWGSAPRPAGSAMAIRADGAFVGSVSSGCVEAAVVARAAEVLRARTPCAMELGVDEETAWTVGLACGGRLEVALWPVEGAVAEAIAAVCALSERGEGAALELRVAGSDARALPAPSTNDDATHLELRAGQPWLRISYLRAPRLVIVGAVHVAQALATIAREAGLEPVIVDPRAQLATRERFPGVTLRVEWPEEALVGLALDARTSLVTLTHEPRLDEPALSLALASPAFYVGALGSRRAHEARCLRLREAGVSERDLARLHAPAGLPIGARTPGEIAVSILAEIIQARRA